MTKNVGSADRIIRIIAGLALGYAAYTSGGPAAIVLGIAGFMAFVTGLIGFCGVYKLFGINTCSVDKP
ncbi:MAG TPA: DUF2892 domain-containing protein [Elusimicrobia bacterium]|nr:MAG: hypothetical protein A2089_04065 [Elusimicrobia bacterium GWD2_63_28]HCC48384.1 DUF2892 domain-containing protein [Elusimicrobiota bacterium]